MRKHLPESTAEVMVSTGAVRFTDSQARQDMLRSAAAIGRHIGLSGNKKLQAHWVTVAAYIEVSMAVMDNADPEEVKSAAMTKEIAAHLAKQDSA